MSDFELTINDAELRRIVGDLSGGSLDNWLGGVAQQMRNDVILQFGSGPGGRTYERGGRTHVASSPGFPPNVDTGTLRASIDVHKIAHLHWELFDGVEYGVKLEEGVEENNLQPRPFIAPVFLMWRSKIFDQSDGVIP